MFLPIILSIFILWTKGNLADVSYPYENEVHKHGTAISTHLVIASLVGVYNLIHALHFKGAAYQVELNSSFQHNGGMSA